jgi:hypothetical protein
MYRDADKPLARYTSLSIVFSVQGTAGSPTRPDPGTRLVNQDSGNPGRLFSSGLQVPGEPSVVGLRTYQHLSYLLTDSRKTKFGM